MVWPVLDPPPLSHLPTRPHLPGAKGLVLLDVGVHFRLGPALMYRVVRIPRGPAGSASGARAPVGTGGGGGGGDEESVTAAVTSTPVGGAVDGGSSVGSASASMECDDDATAPLDMNSSLRTSADGDTTVVDHFSGDWSSEGSPRSRRVAGGGRGVIAKQVASTSFWPWNFVFVFVFKCNRCTPPPIPLPLAKASDALDYGRGGRDDHDQTRVLPDLDNDGDYGSGSDAVIIPRADTLVVEVLYARARACVCVLRMMLVVLLVLLMLVSDAAGVVPI